MNLSQRGHQGKRQPPADTLVIGAGPNGLAAAITLARAGRSVQVIEAKDTIGGGARTAELTLPGFRHDVCSAIHPLGVGSPFFSNLPLEHFGLEWIYPHYAVAHPLDDGSVVTIERSVSRSAETMGEDGAAYAQMMTPLVADWKKLVTDLLGPLPIPPRHPLAVVRFGLQALLPASWLSDIRFRGARARAVFSGMAAHSIIPLEKVATASFGLILGVLAHAIGWPMARGGSQAIMDAMALYLQTLGGEIVTGSPVVCYEQLSEHRAALFDVTPRQLLDIAGDHLTDSYRSALGRYRYGPGVFKVDYALDGPIPWRQEECLHAGTVHLGGTAEEISEAEAAVWRGEHPERPFVLLTQQTLFDPTRAPEGKHTAWAYCHVPNGSTVDMAQAIENQIERFAPGFSSRILGRHTSTAEALEDYNANYIGGDINGGTQTIDQFFTRPVMKLDPYSTSNRRIYLCSSSTPPGGGVHGMCGYFAAQSALKTLKGAP